MRQQLLGLGLLAALAISSGGRVPGELAGVPTFKEQGIDAVYENWRGLIGPKDLKPEQIAFWESVIQQATKTPEWQKALEKNGWGDRYMNNAQSKRFFDEQFAKYKTTYTDLGQAK